MGSFSFSKPRSEGGNHSQFSQKFSAPFLSLASTPVPRFMNDIHDRLPSSKTQSSASGVRTNPFCKEYDKNHKVRVDERASCQRGLTYSLSLPMARLNLLRFELNTKLDWTDTESTEFFLSSRKQKKEYQEPPKDAKLFIGNIPYDIDSDGLTQLFQQIGVVKIVEGVKIETTTEFVALLYLAAMRRILEANEFMRAEKYKGWVPHLFVGNLLKGQTVGVIGDGRIGSAYARIMEVILVNYCRGPVIDEVPLVEHLRENPMFYVGLDVFEDEPYMKPGLIDITNVVMEPHIASASKAETENGISEDQATTHTTDHQAINARAANPNEEDLGDDNLINPTNRRHTKNVEVPANINRVARGRVKCEPHIQFAPDEDDDIDLDEAGATGAIIPPH
ncbi:Glycerate dehydrogenase [Capsicum annuum]|nr:Glycerate dehydrogenase [Capsicum annuum]